MNWPAASISPIAAGTFFLDNQTDLAYLQQQWQKTLSYAEQHGEAILIAHPYQQTIDFFSQLASGQLMQKYEFVKVSRLMR